MIQVENEIIPKGTIEGDLSLKLKEDILRDVKRYYELLSMNQIGYRLILSGALSALLSVVTLIEDSAEIPPGVIEQYLNAYRKGYKEEKND